mmetsp:Transcript_19190/g.31943  ORF Transcript_19190/g.31943 Transcript_19190/m.31943 type:complete len:431 (+) Transcript_19190:107-1399(+)
MSMQSAQIHVHGDAVLKKGLSIDLEQASRCRPEKSTSIDQTNDDEYVELEAGRENSTQSALSFDEEDNEVIPQPAKNKLRKVGAAIFVLALVAAVLAIVLTNLKQTDVSPPGSNSTNPDNNFNSDSTGDQNGTLDPNDVPTDGDENVTTTKGEVIVKPIDKIKHLFKSARKENDWVSSWDKGRKIGRSKEKDQDDPRASLRGSGGIEIGQGTLKMNGKPRYYVSAVEGEEWRNVEVTAYFTYSGNVTSKSHGISIGSRSNHNDYDDNPCNAHGYYLKYWAASREIGVQKEFYHNGSNVIYSGSRRGKTLVDFVPGSFIGVKFVIRDAYDGVQLDVYADYTEGRDGGDWNLITSFKDTNWKAVGYDDDYDFPCRYTYFKNPYNKASSTPNHATPVWKSGQVTLFRTDIDGTEWKWTSIREVEAIFTPKNFK